MLKVEMSVEEMRFLMSEGDLQPMSKNLPPGDLPAISRTRQERLRDDQSWAYLYGVPSVSSQDVYASGWRVAYPVLHEQFELVVSVGQGGEHLQLQVFDSGVLYVGIDGLMSWVNRNPVST